MLDARRPHARIDREHLIPQAWSAVEWQEYACDYDENVEWYAEQVRKGWIDVQKSKTLPGLRNLRRAWKIQHRVRPTRNIVHRFTKPIKLKFRPVQKLSYTEQAEEAYALEKNLRDGRTRDQIK